MALSLAVLLSLFAVAKLSSAAICYDHQTTDYSSRFEPAECGQTCTVTPFFSPDHSLDMYLDVINSASESLDIFTPGTKQRNSVAKYFMPAVLKVVRGGPKVKPSV